VHPILFHIGSYPVASYGLALTLGFAAGIALALRRARARGLPEAPILDALLVAILASLLGARLLWAITHPEAFRPPQGTLVDLWNPFQANGDFRIVGLSMLGGVVLAAAGVLATLRWRGVPVLPAADVLAPSVLLGEAITRVGCFLNGCCYGNPSSLPWAVHFPPGSEATRALGAVAVHPTQLYTVLLSLAGFWLLSRLLLRPPFAGAVLAALGAWLGAQRILLDLVRHHDAQTILWQPGGVPIASSQLISAVLLVAGAVALAAGRRRTLAGEHA